MLQGVTPIAGGGSFTQIDNAGRLAGVIDSTTAREVILTYDSTSVVTKASYLFANLDVGFAYDAQKNLVQITWPDATFRKFVYEDGRWPNNLTGIVDENGARFATWLYDDQGRVVNSQHSGGAEEVAFSYGASSSVATDSLGAARTRGLAVIQGVTRYTGISQPGGSGCAAASSALSYDANGSVLSRDDFVGNRTCFTYDPIRNLETSRAEGLPAATQCSIVTPPVSALPAGSRKITTRWHPEWSLATARAEPGKLTTFVYNGQPDPFSGNTLASCAPSDALLPTGKPLVVLCKSVEQATTDADGSKGFSAVLQAGVANRQRSWTYNKLGQVLTATDPRSYATNYSYYNSSSTYYTFGDLATVTNAAGHITRFTRYDKTGRLLQTVQPSGAITDNTYTPRGLLWTVTVTPTEGSSPQVTTYGYDPVGQLKQVTLPDGAVIQYRYDDAHRLIGLTDQAGNTVDYTLDTTGNRTFEQRKDVNGTIARTISRAYDALNRLESVTGAPQ